MNSESCSHYQIHSKFSQVFDLSKEAPDKVLHRLYCNFEKLKSNGDPLAIQIQKSLRLIVSILILNLCTQKEFLFGCSFINKGTLKQVAGGDGTASWLLGVVSDLKLSHPPPVATVPLGTGNNLPFSFGWVCQWRLFFF